MLKKLLILSLAGLLGGCALIRDWVGSETPLSVIELDRRTSCNTPGPEWQLHYFASAASLRAWEDARGIQLTTRDPVLQGPLVLAELGERKLDGYGLVVSGDASLRGDDHLVLRATQLYPQQVGGVPTLSSPCVLVGVPARHYTSVKIYDQEGKLRAQVPTSRK